MKTASRLCGIDDLLKFALKVKRNLRVMKKEQMLQLPPEEAQE
jgi:hypothetical protein